MRNPFSEFKIPEEKIEYQGNVYILTQPTGADFEFSQNYAGVVYPKTAIRISMLLALRILKNEQHVPLFEWNGLFAGLNDDERTHVINQALDFALDIPAPLCRQIIDMTQELAGLTSSHQEKVKN